MKTFLFSFIVIILSTQVFGQNYITKNGHIRFFSETPIEVIEAHNHQVQSAFDVSTGNFVFQVLIKSFEFEKALMQEHFNENYMESDQFPKASFSGKVENFESIDFSKTGSYEVMVNGELSIHGVTQKINETGNFIIEEDNLIVGKSVFEIKPADYRIKIPSAVAKNIAEKIEVTVEVNLSPLK